MDIDWNAAYSAGYKQCVVSEMIKMGHRYRDAMPIHHD